VGDADKDRQYRGILSFDTTSIPDDAVLLSAEVRLKRQGVVGTDPFKTHGSLLLQIRNGAFNNGIALTLEDFSAIANVGSSQDVFSDAVSNWHSANLSGVNLGLVNKYGVTQFRLLFSKDDDEDLKADYVKFFSGNSATDLPRLIISYSTSGGSNVTPTATATLATIIPTQPTPTPTQTPTPPTVVPPTPTTGFAAIHQFSSQAGNGRIPYGSLIFHDGFFYGSTTYGGAPYNVAPSNPANKGNVFRMNLDGSGFTVLHEFTGGASDGWKPWAGLSISGGKIYGSTVYGGAYGEGGGVLYEMNLDGSGFQLLHAFGEPEDGFGASTSPILVGDTLYGLTRWGGNGAGTIYSYNTSARVYTQLRRFAADSSDGNAPIGTLTAANDGFLYGLTWLGGRNNMGTLFRIQPDGSAFETLYHFAGGTAGKYPYDTLTFDGNHTFYGTALGTYGVDPSDLGVIFKYDLASKTYSVLHKFAGGTGDSGKPNGSVVLAPDGATLYGSTHGDDAWGGKEYGILYQMNLDGTGFTQLHEFKGGAAGASPMQTPLLVNGALYGMTAYGGAENYGLAYRFQTTGTTMAGAFLPQAANLFAPVITSGAEISVAENNAAAPLIAATDADLPAQALTYAIAGGADAALFTLDPATGELRFAAAPDFETPKDAGADNVYNLALQVSDGSLSATQEISVTVAAVNDNGPTFASPDKFSILENTSAVATLAAADADLPAQALTYALSGADSALFTLDPATGELRFAAAPDFEAPKDAGADNVYNLTLQVSDGSLSAAQEISVTVAAVNDNAPAFASPNHFSVAENSTAIATLTAADADLPAQALTYALSGADSALFTLDPATGELRFAAAPDFEAPKDAGADNIYNLTLQVSDGSQNAAQEISVNVAAVNDNAPTFTSPEQFSIVENTNAVATLSAADADLPAQTLTYAISGGLDASKFFIASATGELKFILAPDFHLPTDSNLDNVYEVIVQVSDGGYNGAKHILVAVQ